MASRRWLWGSGPAAPQVSVDVGVGIGLIGRDRHAVSHMYAFYAQLGRSQKFFHHRFF